MPTEGAGARGAGAGRMRSSEPKERLCWPATPQARAAAAGRVFLGVGMAMSSLGPHMVTPLWVSVCSSPLLIGTPVLSDLA